MKHLASHAKHAAGALGMGLERRLAAAEPLAPRPADRAHRVDLSGSMEGFTWRLNGAVYGQHTPLAVRAGDRVEIVFRNRSMMSHPMHLHGHHFQVVGIDDTQFSGALRDTVLVPAHGGRVKVAFDANNPGTWVMHCHNIYHMHAGMMTTVAYA